MATKNHNTNRIRTDAGVFVPVHGKSGTKVYHAWIGMKARCYNKRQDSFPSYGGRGIGVCARWKTSFDSFYADMGDPPTRNHSLDRIDNEKWYSPDNCKWSTAREQQRNKSTSKHITYKGKTKHINDWSNILGIHLSTLWTRLDRGWTIDRALSTPTGKYKKTLTCQAPRTG